MDRRELEIMLNDAFDRGIVTARAVEGIYPPAVTVGILDDLGREIDFGHEGSGLTVFLPGIEDDARFAGSCKALGGKVPQNTYRMELVSAIAGELMGAESATALSALESALDRARRRRFRMPSTPTAGRRRRRSSTTPMRAPTRSSSSRPAAAGAWRATTSSPRTRSSKTWSASIPAKSRRYTSIRESSTWRRWPRPTAG